MSPGTPRQLYDAYVFDLDGTVLLGEALLPTVAETIARLRDLGRRTLFLTNNSTSSHIEYARALTALGVPTAPADVVNSTLVLIDHLKREMPAARLMVVGEPPLAGALAAAGFTLVADPRRTEALVVSFDRTFDYAKLQAAFDAVRAGARFFATNNDRYRPTPGGGQPDAAALIAAIEACTGVRCEAVVGKPSPLTGRYVLARVDAAPERCLLVGDRLETDIRMALDAGMRGALALTGATSRAAADVSPIRPTYVIDRLRDLLPG
ncbi:MAG: HAD-IIA family hydrolase [Proteobacteria bacterium]|nr:HAD-IIA family hydrolase [Pseudomonadota bacterium]